MEYKKITRLSMLLALSILLAIIESFFPIIGGHIPGMKLGISNSVTIITLIIYGYKEALGITILRVILMGILRTGLFSTGFFFSLGGAIFSVTASTFAQKTKLSIIGISIIGAIFHSIGQILVAVFLLKLPSLFYYLPWMILASIITGCITGYLSKHLLIQIQNRL